MYGIRITYFRTTMVLYRKKEKRKKNDKEGKTKRKIRDVNEELINKPRMHVAFSNIIKYAQIYNIHIHVYVP